MLAIPQMPKLASALIRLTQVRMLWAAHQQLLKFLIDALQILSLDGNADFSSICPHITHVISLTNVARPTERCLHPRCILPGAASRACLKASHFSCRTESAPTMDGRNPAPPKKPWNDDSPANTNKQWFLMVSKWCRISSIHSILLSAQPFQSNPVLPTAETLALHSTPKSTPQAMKSADANHPGPGPAFANIP